MGGSLDCPVRDGLVGWAYTLLLEERALAESSLIDQWIACDVLLKLLS